MTSEDIEKITLIYICIDVSEGIQAYWSCIDDFLGF
jgi:hypothetical protein